jgi:hypothetical protein
MIAIPLFAFAMELLLVLGGMKLFIYLMPNNFISRGLIPIVG